jgi:hypothetical protein
MPVYPPAPPSLAGDLLTIHRLLASPTQIQRRLRTIQDLRFVSDQVLTQRFRSSGGAVLYEVSEPIFNTREPEAVPAGAEYPKDVTAEGAAALAAVSKWGQGTLLTDEKIKRNARPGNEVDRVLRKVVNTIIKKVDSITISAVASAVTATQAAGDDWVATTATILRDIELATAAIEDLDMGYHPDSILLSSTKYAYMASDEKISTLRRREATDNPIYGGDIEMLGDLKVIRAPASRLPSNDVWIFDSTQLGGMADEGETDPGYTVDEMAVQVQSERIATRDAWEVWGRRITVPVVQEPGAGIKLTGTNP